MAEQNSGMDFAYSLARQRITGLLKVLRKIEWGGNGFCPGCGARKIDGAKHKPKCPVAEALK